MMGRGQSYLKRHREGEFANRKAKVQISLKGPHGEQ